MTHTRTLALHRSALVCLLLGLAPGAARAQPYDPAYRWRTAETPHFRLHFHQGEEALAAEVASVAERAHAALSPRLGWDPVRTEIVLSDDSDQANGLSTPLPYNTIRLFAAPPSELSELNAYRDWLASLVYHEYVHILHLDHVGGAPAVFNRIFGKIYPPNALTPTWMIEGLAVLHEADGQPGPGTGRNRSAIHSMYLRSLALEPPGFPRLDQASNPSLAWPLGDRPYLLGGRFMEFLQERYGDEAIAGYVARQGSQVWPYAPSHVGEEIFGEDFPELWKQFAAREEARAREEVARVEGRPVTAPRRLTFEGGRAGWPRWAPDGGAILYLRGGLDQEPALVRVGAGGQPVGRLAAAIGGDGLAVGGGRVVLSKLEVWREHRLYDDLWTVDPRSGARRRLTRGARASEPALSADGRWLAYVRRTGPGELGLYRRRLDGGAEERVFSEPGVQVFAPALSADGGRVAFAVQRGGRRDLVLLDGERAVQVTDDEALDASPSFTPDGRWLLFSSDRGGIYDLYAWPVEACLAGGAACAVRQITNVTTGAFQPAVSPDGKTIAFVTYSRDGYDLATLPFRPEEWLDPAPALAPALAPVRAPDAAVAAAPAPLTSRPYSSRATVLPTWWFPLLTADLKGTAAGAMTGGSDVLGRHAYALATWFGFRSRQLGYSAAYLGGWSWPRLDVTSTRYLAEARAGTRRMQGVWTPLGVGLDFTFTRLEWQGLVRLGWDGTLRDVIGVDQGRADRPEQLGRRDGFGSELTLRLAWSDALRFVRSISPEQGRTVTLSGAAARRELGSDYDLSLGRGAVAQYVRVPFTRHAVLALRLAGGAASGSIGTTAPFALGGLARPELLTMLLGTPTAGADELRGYPGGWLEGTAFVLANAEVRFPIASPEWGHSTWPVFLRRIHGAVFADLGDAFDLHARIPFAEHAFRWDELRLGAGAEARLELALAYFAVVDLRLGLAHGFGRVFHGEGREDGVSLFTGYAVLGGGF